MSYAEDWHASVFIRGPHHKTVLIHDETKPLPRLWKFPGGKMEMGEDPFDTVIRETWEETGLTILRKDLQLICDIKRPFHTKYFFTATIDSFADLVKKSKEREVTGLFPIASLHTMVDLHPTYYQFFLEAGGA
jgi:8-oxo-dGTP pyrophosphatase MutT (NUDIX family)